MDFDSKAFLGHSAASTREGFKSPAEAAMPKAAAPRVPLRKVLRFVMCILQKIF
jgi:hypothetical protein